MLWNKLLSATISAPPIITSGLVLQLDASKSTSYPGSGTTWYDLSGNNTNATLVNGVGYSAADKGSLVFDGINDHVDFVATNLSTTATVEMWVKLGTGYSNKMFFGWYSYDVYCPSGNIGFNTGNSDLRGISVSTVSTLGLVNTWHHYVFEMRSNVSYSNNKIYIDGIQYPITQILGSENTTTRNFNNGLGRIGGWRVNLDYKMPMNCSSFNVYNRALSIQEISQNFNARRRVYGI